jgi:hypothetical protein
MLGHITRNLLVVGEWQIENVAKYKNSEQNFYAFLITRSARKYRNLGKNRPGLHF